MEKGEKLRHFVPSRGATFIVRVLNCRQNNWKGEIRWLDGREAVYFRSFLEMVILLQEALEKQGLHCGEDDFRSWGLEKESLGEK